LTSVNAAGQNVESASFAYSLSLTYIDLRNNILTSAALNSIFNSLNDISGTKTIYTGGNPGTATANNSLATAKGWTVNTA